MAYLRRVRKSFFWGLLAAEREEFSIQVFLFVVLLMGVDGGHSLGTVEVL